MPVLLPLTNPDDAAAYLEYVDGVLVTGGDDVNPGSATARAPIAETKAADPARDDFEVALVRAAVAADTPLLCICRGIQVMNVARRRNPSTALRRPLRLRPLQRSVHDVHPRARIAARKDHGRHRTVGRQLLHHQALDTLAPTLVATGRSDDGLVEGVEVGGVRFALGVQWHPEMLRHRSEHLALFEALVAAGA